MPMCLDDVVVLELGERLAVRLCGSLLAQLGATVVTTETGETDGALSSRMVDAVCAAGKLRLAAEDAAGNVLLAAIARRADVVLTSSDDGERTSGSVNLEYDPAAIVCDISAYGTSGPLSGLAHADALVQATSGLVDTTGDPSGPPIPIGVPITEFLGAINAATGVLATLRLQRRTGHGYPVEIALYDCAFETLSTFLARALAGQSPTRVGNRHPNVSPFNTYRARDGLLSLCTGNDEHWRRVCRIIGRDDAALDPNLATGNGRASRMDRVDAMIAAWTSDHSVDECIERFLSSGIPAGPVTPVAYWRKPCHSPR
jgi:crotonobetainyl-CoA:carnitine CoA-transferase CaiB-like acyl-CoA transferase